ncbi:Ribosomal protein S18 acetylase RimI [Ferrimonas marina]|uniref:Ribosomal protein S18 acetylase RimI n=1 Tax=Ferrimonas marina TaxID=299255 RepID=A0A1M5YRX8_9GAMM|nr:Ribosomal protein S18 acetylase RimI [Ferrimonas marina]
MLSQRPATLDDRDFLWSLKLQAMKNHIQSVYGWDEQVQQRFFEQGLNLGDTRVLLWYGQAIGMLELQQSPEQDYLAKLEILPSYQRRGIGAELITQLIANAQADHKRFALQVFRINPALRLYQRLGLSITDSNDTHHQMAIDPAPHSGNPGTPGSAGTAATSGSTPHGSAPDPDPAAETSSTPAPGCPQPDPVSP